jgi:hypothetical protein
MDFPSQQPWMRECKSDWGFGRVGEEDKRVIIEEK